MPDRKARPAADRRATAAAALRDVPPGPARTWLARLLLEGEAAAGGGPAATCDTRVSPITDKRE
jgi:hypothetical protein